MSKLMTAAIPPQFRVPLYTIVVDRDKRQRRAVSDANGKFINSDGLLESIAARGVINPIIVTDNNSCDDEHLVLVAGERRLEASRELGLYDIPIRMLHSLPDDERHIIELEENLRRRDLPWRDEVAAIADLHRRYLAADPRWTNAKTMEKLGYYQNLSEVLRVAKDLNSPRIASCTSIRNAYNILARLDERSIADAVSDIIDAGDEIFNGENDDGDGNTSAATDNSPARSDISNHEKDGQPNRTDSTPRSVRDGNYERPAETSVIRADFIEWAPTYSGPKFNLIHCDFPYGVDLFAGALGGKSKPITYEDSRDIYFALIDCLCTNLHRLAAHSAHIMFWLTSDIDVMHETLVRFRTAVPHVAFLPRPLIWHKTDNFGIIRDPRREPRHIYETAIIGSIEDRVVLRSPGDCYGSPTDKSNHPSAKPEPMLKHFFSMFVDHTTRLLDPTCGGASALRAAEALGAEYVLGLESNAEYALIAQSAMRSFRALRKVGGQ